MEKIDSTLDLLSCISVYKQVKKDCLVKSFIKLFKLLNDKNYDCYKTCNTYSNVCSILYAEDNKASLADYIFDKVLYNENIFSISCYEYKYHLLPAIIKNACEFDLNALYLLSTISSADIKCALKEKFPNKHSFIDSLPEYSNEPRKYNYPDNWGNLVDELANHYKKNGVGIFAKYYAFYLNNKDITPVEQFKKVSMDSLKKYDYQKDKILENTSNFINRRPASNALLYGDRGTGKSTMVKAVLSEFHNKGLRMIQISKEDAQDLNQIINQIKNMPQRFIIFIDDLTFDENDSNFNTLKAVLEGSLNSLPNNVLIYATTNRRHIIKETFSSREGDQLHASDARDESASLADRFGLILTFTKPNLDEFMDIVVQISIDRKLNIDKDALKRGANAFAMKKSSRSGRVAKQYVDFAESRNAQGLPVDKF